MPKSQEKTYVFFIKMHLLLLNYDIKSLVFNALCLLLIKLFKNIRKNLFECQKNTTFAVRNFSRENSVKTHNKLLIKLNGYIKLQNS